MKTLTLSVKNRLMLPEIFAANKDSMTEAAVQRSISDLVRIGTEEATEIEFTVDKDKDEFNWNARKAADKQFCIDGTQLNYLRESVYNLSKARGITQSILPLCELIQGIG